jgi:NNP family nitrate/nitrite transporter-like MFS transporter
LAAAYGWHAVFALAMIPLAVVLVAFVLLAKESPNRGKAQSLTSYLKILRAGDLWWFCLLYSVTFGGFVGLGSFLPLFFRDQYHVTPINAGYLTALVAFVGSGIRPIGGWLADKVGGVRLLSLLLFGISLAYFLSAGLPAITPMVAVLMFGMACLGMGNGAVFQLVPQRFRDEIGIATGVVGAIGGVGGFFLPTLLGSLKQSFGSFASGFVALACLALVAALALRLLVAIQHGWKFSWRIPQAVEALDEA